MLVSGVTSWSLSLELVALNRALRLTVPAPRRTPRLTADNRKPPDRPARPELKLRPGRAPTA